MKFFCDIESGVNIRNQKYFDEMVNKEIKNWVTRWIVNVKTKLEFFSHKKCLILKTTSKGIWD